MERRRYLRQFLALFSGTVLAQVFNFAAYPLLARLYSPEEFGLLGTFIAAAAIPGALACGRFELAITTAPHSGRQAVLWLCFTIALGVSAFATVTMAVYWSVIEAPMLWLMVPLLFVTVLLTGITNALTMFLMRHESFRFASLGVVLRTATTVLVQLGVVLVWPGPMGLIVGFALGLVVQSVMGLVITSRWYPLGRPRPSHMLAMFRRFRPQVSVDIPGSLLAALSFNLLPFFLQYLYGTRAVGFYSIGQRIAVLPLQLFNDALSQVFFQRAARAQEARGEFWQEFRWTLLASGMISLATLAGLIFLAEPVLSFYLGAEWEMSGTILVILAPMLAIRSLVSSLGTAVFVLKRPSWLLYHNVATTLLLVISGLAAWEWNLGLASFLTLYAALQGIEFAAFGALLIYAAKSNYERSKQR